jgi:nucleotide-binding universal stress UspA family protein
MKEIRGTVLACVDGSKFSRAVVDYASWISKTVGNPLRLLHNIESRRSPAVDLSGNLELGVRESLLEELTELESKSNKILMEQGALMLGEAKARALSQGTEDIHTVQRRGSLAESLIEMEEEIRVLVMGIRGEDHDEAGHELGSQLETVIRGMHRPVLVVNHEFVSSPTRIMLAYDESEAARKALDMASTSPLYKGMHCHICHVERSGKVDGNMLDAAKDQLEAAGLGVSVAFLRGQVDAALLDYQRANDIEMTVMGAFGHGRLRELLLGSTTIKMLQNSKIPLLLLR